MIIALGEGGFAYSLRFLDLINATDWSEVSFYQADRMASSANFSSDCNVRAVDCFGANPYKAFVFGDSKSKSR